MCYFHSLQLSENLWNPSVLLHIRFLECRIIQLLLCCLLLVSGSFYWEIAGLTSTTVVYWCRCQLESLKLSRGKGRVTASPTRLCSAAAQRRAGERGAGEAAGWAGTENKLLRCSVELRALRVRACARADFLSIEFHWVYIRVFSLGNGGRSTAVP